MVCDLEDAERGWGLDKYQSRLIRPALKSIMAVPIFDPDTISASGRPGPDARLLGVLSLDSDERLVAEFGSEELQSAAEESAKLIATVLKR